MSVDLLRYEFPITEKIRSLLRLSELFNQLEWFAQQNSFYDHQAAILKYFEIQEVTARGDQKNDILQELSRCKVALQLMERYPDSNKLLIESQLNELENRKEELSRVGIRISNLYSQNSFLKTLGKRSALTAGSCEFDLPAYHHWLNLPAETRRQYLDDWITPLRPYKTAIDTILNLLRSQAIVKDEVAHRGAFQRDLLGKSFVLAQIYVDPALNVVPSFSANRYLLTVRFMTAWFDTSSIPPEMPLMIPFKLGLCNL